MYFSPGHQHFFYFYFSNYRAHLYLFLCPDALFCFYFPRLTEYRLLYDLVNYFLAANSSFFLRVTLLFCNDYVCLDIKKNQKPIKHF